ncbi:MAG: hypothetical protein P9X27_02105 [Candidatus Kaelpia aquatica]|nr:hypothetical protein [Candidatus Kaelpia aquatica]
MEVELDRLIEKIKKEGVQEAKKEADKIIAKAKEEAVRILQEVKSKSEIVVQDAKSQSDKYADVARAAIEQAVRDSIISLREKVIVVFDSLLKRDVSKSLSPQAVKDMIVQILSNWKPGEDDSIEILTSEQDRDSLRDLLIDEFKEKIAAGFEVKVHPGLEKGFRIGVKGEDLHYDFSDQGIADVIAVFLNKEIAEIVNKSLNG